MFDGQMREAGGFLWGRKCGFARVFLGLERVDLFLTYVFGEGSHDQRLGRKGTPNYVTYFSLKEICKRDKIIGFQGTLFAKQDVI